MKNFTKSILLALCLPAMLVSCGNGGNAPKNPGEKADTLRLMTYNVGVFGKYVEDSAPMIASMIKEMGANTCALNELDSCNTRHNVYQAKYLAECLGEGWDYAFGKAISYRGGSYGEGLVTRDTVINRYNITLPQGEGAEQRVCAVIETPKYVYASVHLDHVSSVAALEQARIVTTTLQKAYYKSHKHVFLCGDMNVTPESEVMKYYFKHWTNLSGTGVSFPSRDSKICIDYILLMKNKAKVNVLDAKVCRKFETGDPQMASDHLPVYVELELL